MFSFEQGSDSPMRTAGYEVDPPGQADLSIGSNAVGQQFKCLSFTLEMPFKVALHPALPRIKALCPIGQRNCETVHCSFRYTALYALDNY